MSEINQRFSTLALEDVDMDAASLNALRNTTGNIYYVHATKGQDIASQPGTVDRPFRTTATAMGKTVANQGDQIRYLPGHTETLTAQHTVSKAGISFIGLGQGDQRAALTVGAAIDGFDVEAADVLFQNIRFPASSAASVTARINVDAARCRIQGCHFIAGANDAITITVTANGDFVEIFDNQFHISANGPTDGIDLEGTSDGAHIARNFFNGMNATNSWDTGAINSNAIHTRCLIEDNRFIFGKANVGFIQFTTTSTGLIRNNHMSGGTLGEMLDPGSCMCINNYEADAVDESGSLFPTAEANETIGAIDDATTDTLHGKIGTDTEMADVSLYDMIGPATAATTDSLHGKIGTDAEMADESLYDMNMATERCVAKTDGSLTTPTDALFTITGGPILVTEFVGIVTTVVQAQACTCQIQEVVTEPAGTVNLSSAVELNGDEAGTSYTFSAATPGVLTPTTAGGLDQLPKNYWLCPIGGIQAAFSATNTGVIAWYMVYKPLSPASRVVAAA